MKDSEAMGGRTNTMTVAEFKADFSRILSDVQNGAEYTVLYGRTKRPAAMLVPLTKKAGKRKIGVCDGIATFTEVGGGKITPEEFLGL